MSGLLDLLAAPDAQAHREMVRQMLEPGVDVNNLALGWPVPSQGSAMTIDVSVPVTSLFKPGWYYEGNTQVSIRRMDLSVFFQNVILRFRVTPPITSSWLAIRLQTIFGVTFDPIDYVEEAIGPFEGMVTYQFKAAASSRRWIGQVDIKLFHDS